MGKAKHHRASAGGQQANLQTDIKAVVQAPKPAEKNGASGAADTDERRPAVGAEIELKRDYLDMQDVGEENGLAHCGYLVLRKTEVVKLLYVGSAQTEDADWIYGEVLQSLPPEPAGRRGWFAACALEAPPRPVAKVAADKPPDKPQSVSDPDDSWRTAGRSSGRGPGAPKSGAPSRPQPSVAVGYRASAPSATAAPAARAARAKAVEPTRTPSRGFPLAEAFPALPGHSGDVPSWQRELDEEPEAPEPTPAPRAASPPRPRDVEATIARHRALAAAAAAKAQAKAPTPSTKGKSAKKGGSRGDTSCPICMESISAQRRNVKTSCCGVSLCATCGEKSLRSKRCYFCREEADEFPSLGASTAA